MTGAKEYVALVPVRAGLMFVTGQRIWVLWAPLREGGGAEAAISTAAGSIAGQLHGMVASMDKFQTAHMEVRRAEVAARELEVKSGVSKSKLETIKLAFSMGALTKDEMIAQVKTVMALQ